jgi:predicted enzyme related to lactoylglutathione lyase
MGSSLLAISYDCADARRLGDFWAEVLERPLDEGATAEFASIGMAGIGQEGGGTVWMFHQVPEPKAAKNRVHVDLVAESLDKAVARAVEYGATRLGDFDELGFRWTTLADPEGNEFDIVAAPE